MKPSLFSCAGWVVFAVSLAVGSREARAMDFFPTNAAQFQSALNVSQTDNDDDVITLQGHVYEIANNGGNPFKYVAANTEAHSLTIVGADPGSGQTVIDGGLTGQLMTLDTTAVVGDVDTKITVQGIVFFHGSVTGGGGGLLVHTKDADVVLKGCLFDRNEAVSGGPDPLDGSGGGAALAADSTGSFEVSDTVFGANESENSGGGLALLTFYGDTMLLRNRFHGNDSQVGGGLVDLGLTGDVFFSENIMDQNLGQFEGGGGVVGGSHVDILHNDIFDNTAFEGGGLAVSGSEINIYNNIAFENSALAGSGQDLSVSSSDPMVVRLFNNIFSEFCFINGSCDIASLGDDQGGNLVGVDPLFVNAANGNFGLNPGSPAINAGDLAAPDLPDTDIRGNARVDGPAPDMGAVEVQSACGNGTVETGEECDAGADNNDTTPDACRTTCKNPACGDGVIDTGEICDDGNTTDGDGCPATCQAEVATGGTGGTTTGDTVGTTGGSGGKGGCSLIR